MRGWRIAAAVVLVTTGLAGCIGTTGEELEETAAGTTPLAPEDVEVPEGAELVEIENGVRLILEDVELPLDQEIEVPEGAELVRVHAKHADEAGVAVPLIYQTETDALRCLPPLRQAWNQGLDDATTCSALTAVDPLPTKWRVDVFAGIGLQAFVQGILPVGDTEPARAELVQIDLLAAAPGGVVESIDTTNLSMPHHEIGETEVHEVESHDGTELYVEVTTPEGDHDSHPTILISSPYTTGYHAAGVRAYNTFVKDWVPRGYAVAVADVRGFGNSDGCVNVWGPDEQGDQAALVDWITDQDFSDGSVGMYGVSYPGTTPVEAAVQAPEGLEAIVSTAGVLNAYRDWHFGGVPNGESIGSPTFYQVLGIQTAPQADDPVEQAMDHANGVCDPTLTARANDPRAIYDEYYVSRNFTERAGDIEAAVMVEHAYEDPNVKSSMQLDFFNELDVPKLGLFGHWSHQPAARADELTLRLAWMDQFLKGKELGLANASLASISANGDRYREAPAWPDPAATDQPLYPHFDEGELVGEPGDGEATIVLDGTGTLRQASWMAGASPVDSALVLDASLNRSLRLAGHGHIQLDVTLEGAGNAYVAAYLYDVSDDAPKLVTFGWSNLAHRNGHETFEPVPPGERVKARLPLIPTEYTFDEGDELQLVVRGVTDGDWSRAKPGQPARLTLHGGEDGTVMGLPTLGPGAYEAIPASLGPQALQS